jgi:hypothetical protein
VTHEAEHFAFPDIERDIDYSARLTERLREVADFDSAMVGHVTNMRFS